MPLSFYALPLLETLEEPDEDVADEIQNFVIVVLDGDFEIDTNELGQVAMSVWILRSEDWSGLRWIPD